MFVIIVLGVLYTPRLLSSYIIMYLISADTKDEAHHILSLIILRIR
jgi:hypothetical protein